MLSAPVRGRSLSLVDGVPSASGPFVLIDPTASRSGRGGCLIVVVEPVEPAPGQADLADLVIEVFTTILSAAHRPSPVALLSEAFTLANELVYAENVRRGLQRRVLLGTTCIVQYRRDLYIGQVPPAQALLRQGRELHAFPSVSGWATSPSAGLDWTDAEPIGLRSEIHPDLMCTRAASGDIACAMSTTVAALLGPLRESLSRASDDELFLTTIARACDQASLRHGQLAVMPIESTRVLTRMAPPFRPASSSARAGRQRGIDRTSSRRHRRVSNASQSRQFAESSHAPLDHRMPNVQTEGAHDSGMDLLGKWTPGNPGLSVATCPVAGRTDTEELPDLAPAADAESLLELHDERTSAQRREDVASAGADAEYLTLSSAPIEFSDRDAAETPTTPSRRGTSKGSWLMQLLAGLLLSLVATVVGVWQVSRRDRPLHGPRDDGSLVGMPRLQRWDVSYHPPRLQRLRSSLPRFEIGRIAIATTLVLALVVSAGFAYSRIAASNFSDSEAFERDYQFVLTRHQAAKSERDLPTSYAILIEARARLLELESTIPQGETDSRLVQEHEALEADLDRIANIQRFNNVKAVGRVPTAPDGVNSRLFSGGGRVFLLSDALYQVDSSGGALIRLIGAGDQIGDITVATLRGGAWRGDRPVVVDNSHAYSLDPANGSWVIEELGTFDSSGYDDVGTVESFEQNLYLLAPTSGQILKFAGSNYGSQPDDWASGEANDELHDATDLVVDGHIYALLRNGHILDLFRSRLEATIEPVFVPPVDSPVAISATTGSPYLYVLNASDGRIIRLTREGQIIQQYMATSGSARLSGARDFVIDEGTGVAFILADDAIFSVRVPAAP